MEVAVARCETGRAAAGMMKSRADDLLLFAIPNNGINGPGTVVQSEICSSLDIARDRPVCLPLQRGHILFVLGRDPRQLLGLFDGFAQGGGVQIIGGGGPALAANPDGDASGSVFAPA